MYKSSLFLLLFFFYFTSLLAQQDSTKKALQYHVYGYWRSAFIATDNQDNLKDWYALATGGLLKSEVNYKNKIILGAGYYTSYNLNIQDITARDQASGKHSRYEAGLFDVTDRSKREIHLLGELYIKFKHKKHQLTLGRMKLKSPLLNGQDGRMIPTLTQGIWYQNQLHKHLKLQTGWLTHIAPRSTSSFYSIASSIGRYSNGKNPDGSNAQYRDQLSSKGLGIFALNYSTKKWEIDFWNFYTENIFNTAVLDAIYKININQSKLSFAVEYIQQFKVNNGGNTHFDSQYFQTNQSRLFGGQVKWVTAKKWQLAFNMNRITSHGRFLFPREWGREFLFVFQRRERSEGSGNMNAWTITTKKQWLFKNKSKLDIQLGYGQYYRADVQDFAYNKYGVPANDQLNVDALYHFSGALKGFKLHFLVSRKRALGETYDQANIIINKNGMMNYNLFVNYVLRK